MNPASSFPTTGTPVFSPPSVSAQGPILPPMAPIPDFNTLNTAAPMSVPTDAFTRSQNGSGLAGLSGLTSPPGRPGNPEAEPSQAELAALMQLLGGMGGLGGPGGSAGLPGLLQSRGIGGHSANSNLSMQPDGSIWENSPSSDSLLGGKGLLGILTAGAGLMGAVLLGKRIFGSKAIKELSADAIKAAHEYIGQHGQRTDAFKEAFKEAIQTKDTGKVADLKQKATEALDRFLNANREKVIADRPKLDVHDAVQVAHDEFYGLADILDEGSAMTTIRKQATVRADILAAQDNLFETIATERADALKAKLDHYFETVVRA